MKKVERSSLTVFTYYPLVYFHQMRLKLTDLNYIRTFRILTDPLGNHVKQTKYRATASSKPYLSLLDSRLKLQGLVVDAIDQCTNFPMQADKDNTDFGMAMYAGMHAWHREALQIVEYLHSKSGARELDDTAVYETLVANVTLQNTAVLPSFGDEYARVCELLEMLNDCGYDTRKLANTPKVKARESLPINTVFAEAWWHAACQRNFCSTKEGSIGLVPGAAQKGDLIAIFMGADVPFVIRPGGAGTHVLIGECYVHGIMNGEAFQGREAEVDDIVLQ